MSLEEILDELVVLFPNGHSDFVKLTIDEIALHSAKNFDYAQGGDPLGNFKRRADIELLYPGLDHANPAVIALTDAFKQLDAAMWMLSKGYNGKVEGIDERLRDVHVYMKLARILLGSVE